MGCPPLKEVGGYGNPGNPGGGKGPPSNDGGIMPKPKGPLAKSGEEAILNLSNSDSCNRLDFALRF